MGTPLKLIGTTGTSGTTGMDDNKHPTLTTYILQSFTQFFWGICAVCKI